MLRLATTVALALMVACAIVLVELQIEIAFTPQEAGDRWFGLAVGVLANTAVYAWLYAIAVGYSVSRTFRISSWPRLAGTACLLMLPPVVVDGISAYLDGYPMSSAFEYPVLIMAVPFAAAIFVALVGMTPGQSAKLRHEKGGARELGCS